MEIIVNGKVSLTLPVDATVASLKKEYSLKSGKSIHRLSFKTSEGKDGKKLDDDKALLSSFGISNKATISMKDLGPQIGYRTVFVVEYLGPLLIVLFYASRPQFIYGAPDAKEEMNWVAKLGVCCW